MERILTHFYSLTIIKKFHACGLYLQVTLLSDINTLKGDKLLTTSLQGIRTNHRTSSYAWPRQQRPNVYSWKLWKRWCEQSIALPPVISSNKSLRLRRWINVSTIHYHYLYSPLEQEIYQRDHSTITQWFASAITREYISLLPSTNSTCIRIPPDAYPIKKITPNTFQIEPSTANITPSRTFFKDFEDYIQSMPSWISKPISNFDTNQLSENLVHYIQQQTPLYISTDGSRTNKKSGGDWIISLTDGTEIVSRWNPDFGQIIAINSYHSEIYPSVESLTFSECYCDYFYLQLLNPIEAFCDRKYYLTKYNEIQSNAYSKLVIHKLKEHEVYLALLQTIPKHFTLSHVKGHQHNFKTWDELTIPERLNKRADIIATSKANPPLNIPLPSAPFAIYTHQQYVHLSFQQRIRDSCYGNAAKSFLQSKCTWDAKHNSKCRIEFTFLLLQVSLN